MGMAEHYIPRSDFYSSLNRNVIRVLLLAVGGVSLFVGFVLDLKGYSLNILGEIVGICIALLFGLYVVERLIREGEILDWTDRHSLLFNGIHEHIRNIFRSLAVVFLDRRRVLHEMLPPSLHDLNDYRSVRASISELTGNKVGGQDFPELAKKSYEVAMWDFDQLQEVLTPLAIELSPDDVLAQHLLHFVSSRRNFNQVLAEHNLLRGGRDALTILQSEREVVQVLLQMLEDLIDVYESLLVAWDRKHPRMRAGG